MSNKSTVATESTEQVDFCPNCGNKQSHVVMYEGIKSAWVKCDVCGCRWLLSESRQHH